jgi:hypothetical protein
LTDRREGQVRGAVVRPHRAEGCSENHTLSKPCCPA